MTKNDTVLYSMGVLLGNDLASSGLQDANKDIITKGISDAIAGNPTITAAEAMAIVRNYKTEAVRMVGENFLKANGQKEGITTTASGLQYEVIESGTGPKPLATDKVKTHYEGSLLDGTVFDSSIKRGEPISFPVNGVIKGWQEALQLMSVGDKWKLYIPFDLAYGERGAGGAIPPYATLIFDIHLLQINP